MSTHEKHRVLDLWQVLRQTGTEDGLRRFASQDLLAQCRLQGIGLSAMIALHAYARCRAWQLYYQRTGQTRQARREAALAGHHTRYFRSL